jgi:transcription elongation GreA/GreB family factor
MKKIMEKIPMTRAGYDALEAELKQLKSVERHAIVKAIAEAREHGDLSENAEYHSAREKQSFIEGRIKELEGILSLTEVLDPSKMSVEYQISNRTGLDRQRRRRQRRCKNPRRWKILRSDRR